MILVKANRGQFGKGKENKNSEEKNEGNSKKRQFFSIYKISRPFSYCKKLQVLLSCLTSSFENRVQNLNTFSTAPSTVSENSKKRCCI